MTWLRQKFAASPEFPRVFPFALFLVLTFLPALFGEVSRYWLYLAKTAVGAWLVWEMRLFVKEMKWAISWEAIVVGVGVCVMWIGIDSLYPKFSEAGKPWNPQAQFGQSMAAWFFIAVRLLGSSLVVPPLEEVFYRSFLYRYFIRTDFLSVPLSRLHPLSFIVTSVIFGAEHENQWLAGVFCGLAYQWLVIRKNRIGDAMTAHALTNFLLGVWVVWRGDWKFW
jgi:CAAX prenyl protease-like protein